MWIELVDGAKTQWVPDEECLNSKGVACSSVIAVEHGRTPTPGWLRAPERSILRESADWPCLFESRSMLTTTREILEFYETCISAGNIKKTVNHEINPPAGMAHPCGAPGFRAENDLYRFSIHAFEHDGLVFWTIQYGAKMPPRPRPPHAPSTLRIVGSSGDRANLIDESTGEKYSAPLSSLSDSRPDPAISASVSQQIRWRSLPEWLQFRATEESIGELRCYLNTAIEKKWWANRSEQINGIPAGIFASACKWLDERDFDGTGERTPVRSYFVSVLQDGASLNLHAQSQTGDKAIFTVLDTLGHLSINLNYTPVRGTPLPPRIS